MRQRYLAGTILPKKGTDVPEFDHMVMHALTAYLRDRGALVLGDQAPVYTITDDDTGNSHFPVTDLSGTLLIYVGREWLFSITFYSLKGEVRLKLYTREVTTQQTIEARRIFDCLDSLRALIEEVYWPCLD